MAGKRVMRIGVLLPFSTPASEAQSLLDAAELALFDHGDETTLLIPRDAGASPGSAAAAARDLLDQGADIIIGPIAKEQIAAVAPSAQSARVPIIGFSTDATLAGQGTYLLTFPFEEEVARIVDYATSQGVRRFAILAPDTEYGRRVEAAYRDEIGKRQGALVAGNFYQRSDQAAVAAAKSMAAQIRATGAEAVLVPDSGSALRSIAQTLQQNGFDTAKTKFLGTALWATDAAREPALAGGLYAAPDPSLRTAFDARYRGAYGHAPSRLASLAYDAVAVSETLARGVGGGGVNVQTLSRSDGFLGADGVFRFTPSGTVQRGLAVLEVRAGGPQVIDAAPKTINNRGS